MITTSKVQLTSFEYFKLITGNYFRKKWWFLLLLVFFCLVNEIIGVKQQLKLFFSLFIIIWPLLTVLQLWFYSRSKDNRLFLIERYYTITDEMITGILNDGSESQIKAGLIIKAVNTGKYYLLYISKAQFIYIPKDSFQSNEDRLWFEQVYMKKNG